ncbi:hypothetical protein AOL_s00006g513 [Orbilia oligospora ATCC 24927]|uniref:DUF6603 domain-containing protein n=1 Tax=Arthrobotrys oligospora (strain ATCC 24927 / CBS 115.81 / DSM 1491) TaxID=756982 RepID=G1X0W2_ARTOA|nr:hypothetical protein AOL_s00006g513 [Orbilia oligospora ATCC 24927]EGX53135.1 hypothetical protein AOL_s00006g513 [Orbilia oligospora ATCC 24927]
MDHYQYGVDSYHINVGAGDCAIHLLTRFTYQGGNETIAGIESAVLVDFGWEQGHQWGSGYEGLKQTLGVIRRKYNLNSESDIKFDAVVITHWDGDHFHGLWPFIHHDMTQLWDAVDTLKNDTSKAADNAAPFLYASQDEVLAAAIRQRVLAVCGNFQTMNVVELGTEIYTDIARPLTLTTPQLTTVQKTALQSRFRAVMNVLLDPTGTFLTPTALLAAEAVNLTSNEFVLKYGLDWAVGVGLHPEPKFQDWMQNTYRCRHFKFDPTNSEPLTVLVAPTLPPKAFMETPTGYCYLLWQDPQSNSDTNPWVKLTDGSDTPGFQEDLVFYLQLSRLYRDEPSLRYVTAPQLRFIFGQSQLLGMNLFNPKNPTAPMALSPNFTVLSLMKANSPVPDNTAPGLYIVGANCAMMPSFSQNENPHNDKNDTSIAMIVSWLCNNGQNTSISHYFAGDLNVDNEEELIGWLVPEVASSTIRTTIANPSQRQTYIKTMKLSHHGSLTSTPAFFVAAANPMNLIVSAGSRNGHPRWELMLLLEKVLGPNSRFYATRYPYYLTRLNTAPVPQYQDEGIHYNYLMSYITGNPSALQEMYQEELEWWGCAVWTDFRKLFRHLVKYYQQHTGTKFDPGNPWPALVQHLENWIIARFEGTWKNRSPQSPGTMISGEAPDEDSGSMFNYILVSSRNPETNVNDGLVKIATQNGTVEAAFPCPQNAPANSPAPQLGIYDLALVQEDFGLVGGDASSMIPSSNTSGAAATGTAQLHGRKNFGTSYYSLSLYSPGSSRRLPWVPALANAEGYSRPIDFDPCENDFLLQDVASSFKTPSSVDPEISDFSPIALDPEIYPGTSSGDYYVYCNSLKPHTTTGIDDTIQVLASSSPLNEFITTLHKGVLGLASAPKVGSAVPVVTNDEMLSWFQLVFGTSQISVSGDSKNNITGFEISVPRVPGSTDMKNYTYTNIANIFGTPSDASEAINPCGLLIQENVLVLGLDLSGATTPAEYTTNLYQVMTAFGQGQALSNPIIATAATALVLDIDASDGSRNGLWFAPEDSYRIVVRTQYTCPSAASTSLVGWFGDEPDLLTINNLTVVTKEGWRMKDVDTSFPSDARIAYNSELRISIAVTMTIPPTSTQGTPANNSGGMIGANAEGNNGGTTDNNTGSNSGSNTGANINTTTKKEIALVGILQLQASNAMFQLQIDNTITLPDIIAWGAAFLKIDFGVADLFQTANGTQTLDSSTPKLRRVTVITQLAQPAAPTPNSPKSGLPSAQKTVSPAPATGNAICEVSMDFEILAKRGSPDKSQPVLLWVTYTWSPTSGETLLAKLWNKLTGYFEVPYNAYLPDYEDGFILMPISTGCVQPSYFDILSLIPGDKAASNGVDHVPENVPTQVTQASLKITNKNISFCGTIIANTPKPSGTPQIFLNALSLDASYSWSDPTATTAYLDIRTGLIPRIGSASMMPAFLIGSLGYSGGLWSLQASVSNLNVGNLYQMFDSDCQDSVMDILESVTIKSLAVSYTYGSNGDASNFSCIGILLLGSLELDLIFTYTSAVEPSSNVGSSAEGTQSGDNAQGTGNPSGPGNTKMMDGAQGGNTAQPQTKGTTPTKGTTQEQKSWSFSAKLSSANPPPSKPVTVQDIINSVLGSDVDLPYFLGDISITKPTAGDGVIGLSVGKISNTTQTQPAPSKGLNPVQNQQPGICFVTYALMDGLSFTFTQYKSIVTAGGAPASTKRLIKASVSALPQISVPLLGDLTQPFDEMYFLWVQDSPPPAAKSSNSNSNANPGPKPQSPAPSEGDTDPTNQSPGASNASVSAQPGITKHEFEQINAYYAMTNTNDQLTGEYALTPLNFKPKTDISLIKDTDIVIEAGWHFVLVTKDSKGEPTVIIDYAFGGNPPPPPSSEAKSDAAPGTETPNKPSADSDEDEPAIASPDSKTGTGALVKPAIGGTNNGASKNASESASSPVTPDTPTAPSSEPTSSGARLEPLKKKQGPLSINNIGFEYKNNTIYLLFDATFNLGPIGFTLVGMKIGITLKKGAGLADIDKGDFHLSLEGLEVAFDKAPITATGAFIHGTMNGIDYYSGGIIIGFEPWLFQAAGFYGQTKSSSVKNVFLFMQLNGPIVTVGFASISGLTGGFGYNMDLRWPTVAEVPQFPFLIGDSSTPPSDPMTELNSLINVTSSDAWVTPKADCMWFAVGLSANAFKVLSVDAVVVVQFAPAVRLGIYGVATCDIPSTAAKKKLAHVELGISATVDPETGTLKIDTQLSPTSYILDPSCHLTGGFSLYSWWQPKGGPVNPYAGDWVLTIGGYNPAFQVPSHYPQAARLAISWSLGSTLSITGDSYFAITPKCCMAGGGLHAALSVGPLSAWFDTSVDFLINYEPFHFTGDGSLSVGVAFTLDLWLVTIHINIELSATLYIEGPPIRGHVTVDFWVHNFSIAFGEDDDDSQKPVSLQDFYNSVLMSGIGPQASSTPSNQQSEQAGAPDQAHLFTCSSGLIPPTADTTPTSGAQWEVKAGDSLLAGNSVMYAKPMQMTGPDLSSTLYVQIFGPGQTVTTTDPTKAPPAEGNTNPWAFVAQSKSLPSGLWGQYDASDDPSAGGNGNTMLAAGGGTCQLCAEVVLTPPPAQPSDDLLAQFNSAKMSMQTIYFHASAKSKGKVTTPPPNSKAPPTTTPPTTSAVTVKSAAQPMDLAQSTDSGQSTGQSTGVTPPANNSQSTDTEPTTTGADAPPPEFPALALSNPNFDPVASVSGAAQWSAVSESWGTLNSNTSDIVTYWASQMLWGKIDTTYANNALTPAIPELLLAQFDDLYMEAPQLGPEATAASS